MPKVTDYIVALYGCPSNNELVIWLNLYNRTLPFLTSPHCTCNMLLNSEEGNSGDIHPWRDVLNMPAQHLTKDICLLHGGHAHIQSELLVMKPSNGRGKPKQGSFLHLLLPVDHNLSSLRFLVVTLSTMCVWSNIWLCSLMLCLQN